MPAGSPEEIHALTEDAFNTGDLDAFGAIHEKHAATFVPPDGRRAGNDEATRDALRPIFALRPSARIEIAGKLPADGLARTQARPDVVAGDGPERLQVSGRGTTVSRRQPARTWLVVLDNPMSPA